MLEVDLVTMALWWVDLSVCDEAIQREEGGSNGGWDVEKGAEPKGFFNKPPRTSANTQVPLSDFFVLNGARILMQRPHFHARHRGTFL